MKKLFSASIILMFAIAFSGCLTTTKGLIGGEDEEKSDFDSETVMTKFRDSLFGATKLTIEAIEAIQTAVGNKEDVVKMQQLQKDLVQAKEENDDEGMKKIYAQINNSASSIDRIDLMAKAKGKEAKQYIETSLLKTSVAGWLDKRAFDYAKLLVDKLPDEISSNPMQAGNLKPALSLSKMAVSELPEQIENIGIIGKKVGEYASKKGLPKPSPAKKKEIIDAEASSLSDDADSLE